MKNKNSRFCIFLLYLTKVGVFHAVDLSAQFRNRVSFGEVWNKSGLVHSLDCLGTWNLEPSCFVLQALVQECVLTPWLYCLLPQIITMERKSENPFDE